MAAATRSERCEDMTAASFLTVRSQRPGDLLGAVALDHVADFDVVEVLDADAALVAFLHFLHVVLEAAERADRPVVDLLAVPNDADAALAVDQARAHVAPRDHADTRHLER